MRSPSDDQTNSAAASFWRRLSEPSVHVLDPETRRRARLLSALLVATLILGVIAIGLTILDIGLEPSSEDRKLLRVPLAASLFVAMAYWISRTRLYLLAASTTVGVLLLSTLAAYTLNPVRTLDLAFVILGGLISSLFLSARATILVFAATILSLLALPVLVPGLEVSTLTAAVFFALTVGVVVVVSTAIRESDLGKINRQTTTLAERDARLSAALASADEANERLQSSIRALEANNRDAALLAEMGSLLNLCARLAETYGVISSSAQQLFPEHAGVLYVFSESRNDLEAVAAWNRAAPEPLLEMSMATDACWALRRGRVHRVEPEAPGALCRHLPSPPPGRYLCAPMMSQGEVFGVLHIRSVEGDVQPKLNEGLAASVAEQIALALTSLQLREKLRNQSIRDPLTGLFNQRYMLETLDRELQRAARKSQPLAVAMLDVDHFKNFNDNFGHEAGDLVMKHIGQILDSSIRGSDIACRYGGEEFALILPEAGADVTRNRLGAVRANLRDLELQNRGQRLGTVTLSAGIAVFPEHGRSADDLLRSADSALYRAKAEGRDRILIALPDALR